MTNCTFSISGALREAQLQYLEAHMASKLSSRPQRFANAIARKDKDELGRNCFLKVILQL